jgi:hypothetical protein
VFYTFRRSDWYRFGRRAARLCWEWACLIFFVAAWSLAVVLLPSSAWSAGTDGPAYSERSSRSVSASSTSLRTLPQLRTSETESPSETPAPSPSETPAPEETSEPTSSPSETPSETPAEPSTESPSEPPPEPSSSLASESCSPETPCVVTLTPDDRTGDFMTATAIALGILVAAAVIRTVSAFGD